MDISRDIAYRLWEGFDDPPFSMILVSDEYEYLIDHHYESDEYVRLNFDTVLFQNVHRRQRKLPDTLMTTIEFHGLNTILACMPENIGLTTTEWVISLLNERFNQYLLSYPKYFQDMDNLDFLSFSNGRFQEKHPFLFDDEKIEGVYFRNYATTLYNSLATIDSSEWEGKYKEFLKGKLSLKSSLSPIDYTYISFILWQKGISIYTTNEILELIVDSSFQSNLKSLPDFQPYSEFQREFWERNIETAKHYELSEDKKEAIGRLGFAEVLILQKTNPKWKEETLENKFDLGKFHLWDKYNFTYEVK